MLFIYSKLFTAFHSYSAQKPKVSLLLMWPFLIWLLIPCWPHFLLLSLAHSGQGLPGTHKYSPVSGPLYLLLILSGILFDVSVCLTLSATWGFYSNISFLVRSSFLTLYKSSVSLFWPSLSLYLSPKYLALSKILSIALFSFVSSTKTDIFVCFCFSCSLLYPQHLEQ